MVVACVSGHVYNLLCNDDAIVVFIWELDNFETRPLIPFFDSPMSQIFSYVADY